MPTLPWRLLHLLALCTLGITQPVLAILGDNPTFFTFHGSGPAQLVWFALAIALVPAAVLAAVETGVHLVRPQLDRPVHLAMVSALVFLVTVQMVDVLPGPWPVPTVAAIAIAAGVVVLYAGHDAIRSVVSVLAVTPVVFVGLFLLVAPTSRLVFPDDVEAITLAELVTADTMVDGEAPADDRAEPPTRSAQINARFPPVYLLVFDELPVASLLDETGAIDAVRWPNFARLADSSHFFANATTVGQTTERAVPSILTGRYETAAAPVYSLYPENLFTLLGDIYDVSSTDPLVDLCPPSVCDGRPPASVVELLAGDVAEVAEAAEAADVHPTDPPAPAEASPEPGSSSSLGALLDDALVVFGHLVAPEGIDLGLPDIGSSWGDFGGDFGGALDERTDAEPDRPTTTAGDPVAPGEPAAPIPSLPIGPGPVDPPTADPTEIDTEGILADNVEFLDRLLTDDSRVADFRAEIAAFTASDVPRLHYLHTLLPHVPWRLHAGGETYADLELPGYFSEWDDDPTTARAAQQRHLLQVGFADRLLGEYLDRLERAGILDDATVIVVADHGVSFLAGEPARLVNDANVGAVAGVPLFYKRPGQVDSVVHHEPVETTDIVPTLAAQLDIEIPWAVDGVDLFGSRPARDRLVHSTFSTWIPEPFEPVIGAVTTEMLAVFGDGTDGSLYGLAGLHDRIGGSVADLIDRPAGYCWTRERPAELPEPDGEIGFVSGRFPTGRGAPVPLAVTVGATLTGTSMSLDHDGAHRVYALGDPRFWMGASVDEIGLHEIVDGRLRPIPEC